MTIEKLPADLEALASEVCDMWQDYFSALASGAASKADLTQLLEPQRRMFADFMSMMQHAPHGTYPNSTKAFGPGGKSAGGAAPSGAAPLAFASDDGSLRVAQLAHRVAELEKRLAKLEHGSAGAAKTSRSRGKPTH
jgi:hypothetical protein